MDLNKVFRPSNPRESKRISECGYKIKDGRIQGNLAVARAFGDFQFKRDKEKDQLEQAVSCLPDVNHFTRSDQVSSFRSALGHAKWDYFWSIVSQFWISFWFILGQCSYNITYM